MGTLTPQPRPTLCGHILCPPSMPGRPVAHGGVARLLPHQARHRVVPKQRAQVLQREHNSRRAGVGNL
eukprot:9485606-Pyramimonas_sp.AAC.1